MRKLVAWLCLRVWSSFDFYGLNSETVLALLDTCITWTCFQRPRGLSSWIVLIRLLAPAVSHSNPDRVATHTPRKASMIILERLCMTSTNCPIFSASLNISSFEPDPPESLECKVRTGRGNLLTCVLLTIADSILASQKNGAMKLLISFSMTTVGTCQAEGHINSDVMEYGRRIRRPERPR